MSETSTNTNNHEYNYFAGAIIRNYHDHEIYTLGVNPLVPLSDELLPKRWQQDCLWEMEGSPSPRSSPKSIKKKFARNRRDQA